MAKGGAPGTKGGKGGKGAKIVKGPPHIHARIAYLNKIATLMASNQDSARHDTREIANGVSAIAASSTSSSASQADQSHGSETSLAKHGVPYLYGSQLRAISRKGQVALSQDLKRSLCRVCNGPLIQGQTCTEHLENRSRGGRKPTADVKILHCSTCGTNKRFPVGARRQLKKSKRLAQRPQLDEGLGSADDHAT